MDEQEDNTTTSSVTDHKLCGFLCAVLTVTSSHPLSYLRLGTRFHILRRNSEVVFTLENDNDNGNDVVLSPVYSEPQCEGSDLGKKEKGMDGSRRKRKRKKRSIGLVNGSISVLDQIYALVANKCLQIDARMVWAEAAGGCGGLGEVRVVLLVDVYLPIELWSGWQFPKCGSVAGAVFRHLR